MNDDDNVFDVELYNGGLDAQPALFLQRHISQEAPERMQRTPTNQYAQQFATRDIPAFRPRDAAPAPVPVPVPVPVPAPVPAPAPAPAPAHNGISLDQENARQHALQRDENARLQKQISDRESEDRERTERIRRESLPYTTARPTYVSPYIVQSPVVHHYTNEYNPIVYRRLYDYGVGYIPTYYSYDQRRRAEYLLENLIKKELLAKVTEEELQKVIKTTLANTDTNGKIITKEKVVRVIAKKPSKKTSKKKSKKTSKKKSKKVSKKKAKKSI